MFLLPEISATGNEMTGCSLYIPVGEGSRGLDWYVHGNGIIHVPEVCFLFVHFQLGSINLSAFIRWKIYICMYLPRIFGISPQKHKTFTKTNRKMNSPSPCSSLYRKVNLSQPRNWIRAETLRIKARSMANSFFAWMHDGCPTSAESLPRSSKSNCKQNKTKWRTHVVLWPSSKQMSSVLTDEASLSVFVHIGHQQIFVQRSERKKRREQTTVHRLPTRLFQLAGVASNTAQSCFRPPGNYSA